MLAGCSTESPPQQSTRVRVADRAGRTCAGVGEVGVRDGRRPADLAQSPFDEPRQALIPDGWTMSVWARIPKARLETWTPDGALLVSVPASRTDREADTETGAAPQQSTLLEGLDQPHGMAFAGSTLYVAESDQIDAYDYADGAATNRRTVAADLPDARSPELRGAYAHALKSVAVGPDGAVYFSIGSTGNISAEDRDANPPRATIMRIPPAADRPSRSRRVSATAPASPSRPDGSLWTAVNNRDNAPDPNGNVDTRYVNEHPPEALARLTPGRELGWPYCNPDGGPADLPFIRDMSTNSDGSRMDCAALPPVEQSLGAHAAPLGLAFTDRCAAAAVCRRRAGRCARLVEPAAAARTRGVVLPLARRQSG